MKKSKREELTTKEPAELLRDAAFLREYEQRRQDLAAKADGLVEAVRSSQRLSDQDFSIRMNAR